MDGQQSQTTFSNQPLAYSNWGGAAQQYGQAAQNVIPTLGQAYGGQLTAPLNDVLTGGYSQLQNFANQPLYTSNPMYQNAKTLMSDTLTGKYLGDQSQFNKYLGQKAISEDFPAAEAATAGQLSRTGSLGSSNAQTQIADIGDKLGEYLGGLRAQDYDTQMQRMYSMIQPAMTAAQQEAQAPAQQIATEMQLAQPYQNYSQQALDAQYKEFNRQREEQLKPLDNITQFSQMYAPQVATTTPAKQSTFSQYIQPAMMASSFIPGMQFMAPLAMGAGMFDQSSGQTSSTQGFMNSMGQSQQPQGMQQLLDMLSGNDNQGAGYGMMWGNDIMA